MVVEEGSEDETTEDDSESIYDEIKKYSQLVEDYKSKILELSDKIEQVKTDIKSDLTIIPKIETTEDGSLNSKWYTLPNTKAVYDFITNYITLTELSNSEMLTENFWNRDFITGTIYHIKDDDTTIVSSDKENNEYKIKIPSYFKIVELPDGTYKAKYEEV